MADKRHLGLSITTTRNVPTTPCDPTIQEGFAAAIKSVGGEPLFISRGFGARLEDVDGNTYIDYVMSWGPLIHGHAPRGASVLHWAVPPKRSELPSILDARRRLLLARAERVPPGTDDKCT